MSTLALPNTITNGTTADATEVQANDAAIVAYINDQCITKDGTETMTGFLTLLASDPTDANHAVRKSYVDALKRVVNIGQAACSGSLTTTTSAQDITGCTTGALSLVAGDVVEIVGVFDVTGVSGIVTLGTLDIGGVEQTPQALHRGDATPDRATVSQTWLYTVPSTASYTFKLRGRHSSGATGATIGATHTTITWKTYR